VGTGGAGVHAFNISTAVAFIVAASGIKVAKHGNRAASSHCGSADVLEFMGIPMDTPPKITQEAIKKIGVGFLFAPTFHPAFKVVAPVRKQIGIKTIFNILGPLCNPAQANVQLLGVFDPDLLEPMARALKYLGGKRAFVVYGETVKDEVSLMGATRVMFLNNKSIKKMSFYPSHFGLKKCSLSQIEVKNAKESARVITDILRGKKGPHLDIVLANAAASFLLLNKAKNLKTGVSVARQLIENGKAKEKFLALKRFLGEHHEL
jgi:anthranilate phosphoribosyltransferase